MRGICIAIAALCACRETSLSVPGPKGDQGGHTTSSADAALVESNASHLWGGWHRVSFDRCAEAALTRAWEFEACNATEKAIAALNTGLERTPHCATLFEVRGALYRKLGYRRAAERDFGIVTRTSPGRASGWLALGRVRQELGLPRAALTALRESRRLGSGGLELELACARSLRRLDRPEDAAACYARALEGHEGPSSEFLAEIASLADSPGAPPADVLATAWEQFGLQSSADEPGTESDLDRRARAVLFAFDAERDSAVGPGASMALAPQE